jgi:hypothetical protein
MLDPILKRLRQIVKASQPSSTHSNSRETQHQPPVNAAAAADCAGNSILSGNNSTPYELLGASPLSPPHRSVLHTPSVDVLPPGRTSNSSRPSPNSRLGQQQQQQRQPQQLLAINATPASSLPGESSSPDSGDKSRVSWHLNFFAWCICIFFHKGICPPMRIRIRPTKMDKNIYVAYTSLLIFEFRFLGTPGTDSVQKSKTFVDNPENCRTVFIRMRSHVWNHQALMIPPHLAFFFLSKTSSPDFLYFIREVFYILAVLACLFGDELPVVPLGPVGECLPRVVLHPSILPPNLFPSREEQPALCVFCNFSWQLEKKCTSTCTSMLRVCYSSAVWFCSFRFVLFRS